MIRIIAVVFGTLCLFGVAKAEEAFASSGKCGTSRLKKDAACACYVASITKGTPKEMITACQTAFGSDLSSLASSCEEFMSGKTVDKEAFMSELGSLRSGCASTYSKKKVAGIKDVGLSPEERLNEMDSGVSGVDLDMESQFTDKRLYAFYWPWGWPYWYCYGWYWCIWWWIIRFWWCFWRWNSIWYRYCPW